MSTLKAPFRDPAAYAPAQDYRLLPFRFTRLDATRYVITNDVGEHVVATRPQLVEFVNRELSITSALYRDLKARHLLFDDRSRVALDLLALKYRTRAAPIANLTALHMFVVTLRCDHTCAYCQVSRVTEDRSAFDMSEAHAEKALAFAFSSPSPNIKIEFQGGEPLLNFALIRHIVKRGVLLAKQHEKNVQFVIATNLTKLSDDILDFAKAHEVYFSTSLDGPADLHDKQRPLPGHSSHAAAVAGIMRIREVLGPDHVSALMTTTPSALSRVTDIVDEYVRLGFHSIFLRTLSPYGFATKSLIRKYDTDDWLAFYKRGLDYILELNRSGYFLREEMTCTLLMKMFDPLGSRYVDLQSPAGIAIGGIVYNYDGSIYASDEGRMLAEMGDKSFRLGHVDTETFASVMTNDELIGILEDTMPESAPMCSDCAFLPWCGADPSFHQATQGDVVGHKAFSSFCAKQMGMLRHLVTLLEDDPAAARVLRSWVSC